MHPHIAEYDETLLKNWTKSGVVLPFLGFTASAYPKVIWRFFLEQ